MRMFSWSRSCRGSSSTLESVPQSGYSQPLDSPDRRIEKNRSTRSWLKQSTIGSTTTAPSASPWLPRTTFVPGVRGGQETGDHQLPHVPPGARRPVLRAHLRSGTRLGVRLRQVQGHQVQGHHLRPLRGEGHALARPPEAHGPHQPGRAHRPHLVLQGHAQPPGQPAGHEDQRPGEGRLLPGLHGGRSGHLHAQAQAASHGGGIPRRPREIRRVLQGRHGCRGRPHAADRDGPRRGVQRHPRGHRQDQLQAEDQGPTRSGSRSSRPSATPRTSPTG